MENQSIQLTLAANVIYVSGTVNGAACVFTLESQTADATVWTGTVPRAADDVYHIFVTAVDSIGNTTECSTVLYYGLQYLITDRTSADVMRWRQLRDKGYAAMTTAERAEWNSGSMKGAYNVSDLNRVGTALNFVKERLVEAGYLADNTFNAKTNWNAADIMTAAVLADYLNAVKIIRQTLAVVRTTPLAPAYSGCLSHSEANNIEQIITDVYWLYQNMTAAYRFCGTLESGEDNYR